MRRSTVLKALALILSMLLILSFPVSGTNDPDPESGYDDYYDHDVSGLLEED